MNIRDSCGRRVFEGKKLMGRVPSTQETISEYLSMKNREKTEERYGLRWPYIKQIMYDPGKESYKEPKETDVDREGMRNVFKLIYEL